jgi:hypothetical protein
MSSSLQQYAILKPLEQFQDNYRTTEISISDIVCEHGALDPTMSRDMKLLTPVCCLDSMELRVS